MHIVKNSHNIYLALAFIFIVNIGLANTDTEGKEKKSTPQIQEQDGRRQQDDRRQQSESIIRPDGDVSSEDAEPDEEYTEVNTSNSQTGVINLKIKETEVDSLEDDSVSKYNFIFYFLYKFKYDSETSP